MRKKIKRLTGLALAVVMLFSLVPTALAAKGDPITVSVEFNGFRDENGKPGVTLLTSEEELSEKVVLDFDGLFPAVGAEFDLTEVLYTTDMKEDEIGTAVPYLMDGTQKFVLTNVVLKWGGRPPMPSLPADSETLYSSGDTWKNITFTIHEPIDKWAGQNKFALTWKLDGETKVEPRSITYSLNRGDQTHQLPEDALVYHETSRSQDNALEFNTGFDDTKVTVLTAAGTKVANGTTIEVRPDNMRDLIGRKQESDGTYTYYQLLGWMLENDASKVYSMGEQVQVNSDMSFVAQWKLVTEEELVVTDGPEVDLSTFDAEIEQHASPADSDDWTKDPRDKPLELNSDNLVFYQATLTMNRATAEMLNGENISSPDFANFSITVQMDKNLQLVDKDTVTFSFACTFLEPTGKIVVDGNLTDVTVTGSNPYTFTVPVGTITDTEGFVKNFSIPVQWKSGRYDLGTLREEISLAVACAKIPDGYSDVVATTGVITGSIDPTKSPRMNGNLSSIAAAYISSDSAWSEVFGGTLLGNVKATKYLTD